MSGLAVDGGKAVRSSPLPPWPHYSEAEIECAARILASGRVNYWTGEECKRFEAEFAERHWIRHGIALANGTLALELALRVIGIGYGDEVIVTPRSYFASASAIVLSGAKPVFADVDRSSQNVTAGSIEARISPRTRALMLVHLAGWPCDMTSIMELARKHQLRVIEDCAQALGASHDGRPVGSFGDVGCFSFCQDKIVSTAGEGGMFVTEDDQLWKAGWSYKEHGKSWSRTHDRQKSIGFRWLHEGFGSNLRLTEIQAGIGRLQMLKLDSWIRSRRRNAMRLKEGLEDLPILRIPMPSEKDYHAYYKFYVFLNPEFLSRGWTRDRILRAFEAEGIPGLSGSCPEMYRERAFAKLHHPVLPVAYELGQTSIMYPVHPTLSDSDIDDMIEASRKVLLAASA